MKWKLYILVMLAGLSCREKEEVPKTNLKAEIVAISHPSSVGDGLEFQFHLQGNGNALLLLENSFGPLFFQPKIINDKAMFNIPPEFTEEAGEYHWKLVSNSQVLLSDKFYLGPRIGNLSKIETYFGPRSIRAGGQDYSMLTVIPTDDYDNPLPDSTLVAISQQINSKTNVFEVRLKDGLAYSLLYGEEKSGRMLVTAALDGVPSKELTSIVSPSNSTDFKIGFERVHDFADGNQVIRFMTSPITDRFGNTVNDGTLVNFIVKNKRGELLKSTGTTLAGIATANMLHPNEEEEWGVTAYITGEAKSNGLQLNFKSAIKDFEVKLSKNNRKIIVGPILGFMGQLVPEGLVIELKIYDSKGDFIEAQQTHSRSGMGSFELEKGFYPRGDYQITVECAGVKKEMRLKLTQNEVE